MARRCESPIEEMFARIWSDIDLTMGDGSCYLTLVPQVQIDGGRYRLDFAVAPAFPDAFEVARRTWADCVYPDIAIELDGHEFHEKTKQQVAYRNARDRFLMSRGWRVFHVSGHEVVRSGAAVVESIYLQARDELIDLLAADYLAREARP